MKRASDNLVKAAQKAAFDAVDNQPVDVKIKMVGGIAQVSHRAKGSTTQTTQNDSKIRNDIKM